MTGIQAEQTGMSIRKFAEVAGASHTEIRRQMKRLKIEGNPQGRGKPTLLSGADQLALEEALGLKRGPEAIQPAAIEVFDGNHRTALVAPPMGSQVNLERFRGSVDVQHYEDPAAAANAALQLMGAVSQAMDSDLNHRFETLERTQQANRQLRQGAEQLQAKGLEYRITQNILARLQNGETAELSENLGKAQSLSGQSSQE